MRLHVWARERDVRSHSPCPNCDGNIALKGHALPTLNGAGPTPAIGGTSCIWLHRCDAWNTQHSDHDTNWIGHRHHQRQTIFHHSEQVFVGKCRSFPCKLASRPSLSGWCMFCHTLIATPSLPLVPVHSHLQFTCQPGGLFAIIGGQWGCSKRPCINMHCGIHKITCSQLRACCVYTQRSFPSLLAFFSPPSQLLGTESNPCVLLLSCSSTQ